MKMLLELLKNLIRSIAKGMGISEGKAATFWKGGPIDLPEFNAKFIAANQALAKGNTEGLKDGIGLLIDSLSVAGDFADRIGTAIQHLYCALSHHDRADTKGPWNRDLSGYGLFSWSNDIWDRNDALLRAWSFISSVNDELKIHDLGWKY